MPVRMPPSGDIRNDYLGTQQLCLIGTNYGIELCWSISPFALTGKGDFRLNGGKYRLPLYAVLNLRTQDSQLRHCDEAKSSTRGLTNLSQQTMVIATL